MYWLAVRHWSDPDHYPSGASGACVPAAIDQVVFFDANSGLANGIADTDVTKRQRQGIDFSAAGDITVNGRDHQCYRQPCVGTGDELERSHHEPAAGSFRHRSDEQRHGAGFGNDQRNRHGYG